MNKAIRHPAWCYRLLISLFLGTIAFAAAANAHESRPAYLEIDETAPGRYDVIWRTPVYAGMRLPIALKFSEAVSNVTEPAVRELPDSLVERRIIKVTDSIAGKRIDFVGLQATITDVLVRARLLDGSESTTVVRPSKAWVEITGSRGLLAVASSYALLGVEHILFGVDHLLFVLALLILVKGWRKLVGTITAFTVAHSITLAAATLGFVHVPGKPVEATIALSIVFVACEIVHSRQGRSGLTEMWPWVIAFSFGLLHGLGFAGALREVGLPQNAIPLALLSFNVGVELCQLLFISIVMAVVAVTVYAAKRFSQSKVALHSAFAWCESVSAYAIGAIAAFWLIERTLSFVT
jgi:hydrogenase/urease accessory protein HupE